MKSELTPQENRTINFYDRAANEWVTSHLTRKFWGQMDGFYQLLPEGKVLEVGCGGGRDAEDYLIGKYDYVGIDPSEGLLSEARKRYPNEIFLNKSVYNLDFPEGYFDGFWAAAMLLHIPKTRLGEALISIHKVVKGGGVGFISIKQGEGEKEEEDGRFYAYYSNKEFEMNLDSNGFEVIEMNVMPMSEKAIWLVYLVRAKKDPIPFVK